MPSAASYVVETTLRCGFESHSLRQVIEYKQLIRHFQSTGFLIATLSLAFSISDIQVPPRKVRANKPAMEPTESCPTHICSQPLWQTSALSCRRPRGFGSSQRRQDAREYVYSSRFVVGLFALSIVSDVPKWERLCQCPLSWTLGETTGHAHAEVQTRANRDDAAADRGGRANRQPNPDFRRTFPACQSPRLA